MVKENLCVEKMNWISKYAIALCVLSMTMPAFAKPNYEYQMIEKSNSNEQIALNTQLPISQIDNFSGNQIYAVESTSVPTQPTISQEEKKVQKNKKSNEKISQVGSTLYYDSGEKSFATGAAASAAAVGVLVASCLLDPYIVTLDGKEYMMIKDSNGIFESDDILGINDDKNNTFRALLALNTDNDRYITGTELKKAGIRLVRKKNNIIYFNDKSKDFDIDLVKYVPTESMRKTYYNTTMIRKNFNTIATYPNLGSFGTYDIYTYVNHNKKTTVVNFGRVDFVKESEIKKWLSGNK